MRLTIVVCLVMAAIVVDLVQSVPMKRPGRRGRPGRGRGNRGRDCLTDDGQEGVCVKRRRCDNLPSSGEVTFCGNRRRQRQKVCCPAAEEGDVEVFPPSTGGGTESGALISSVATTITPAPTTAIPAATTATPDPTVLEECGISTPQQIPAEWIRTLKNTGQQRRRRRRQSYEDSTPGPFIPFIVGGTEPEIGKWPWIALFGNRQSDGSPFWFCGGALIDRQHILTAAHCLRPRAFQREKLIVRLGEHDTSNAYDGASPVDYGVESITNHAGFKFPSLHDDISLVKLDRPVEFTDLIRPICLPSGPSGDYSGERIQVAGWGYTQFNGNRSSVLQEVTLPVVGIDQCQSKYESAPSFQRQFPGGFGDTKLCAGETEGGKDACQGDSGGPMVHERGDGRYELIGVVSAGVGCGSPGFPGLYTRVSAYRDWIQQNKT